MIRIGREIQCLPYAGFLVTPFLNLLKLFSQANYRWLCDGKNQINKGDRQELIRSFKALIYAETKEDFEERKNPYRIGR